MRALLHPAPSEALWSGDGYRHRLHQLKELAPFTQASWSGEVSTSLHAGDIAIAPVVDWTEILTLQDKGAPGGDRRILEEGARAGLRAVLYIKSGASSATMRTPNTI